ncbi:MAG: hypothetical protein J6C92_11155, partial [Bacteroidaceae bacterium]|nr:hypothetical protein [Bacteroidaceae bacterium]
MKNNWFKRSISLILAMVLLLQCAPLQIWAAETSATVAEVSSETTDSAASVQQIVGEEVSLREEGVKHFRLSDGSYIAVSYGMPVHYKDSNGDWQDIDNRPIMATAGEDDVYQISNAGLSTSFSSTLTNGDVLTSSYGNASVKMSLLDTEQALTLTGTPQMDTELDSETTIEAETAPTVPEETAPPETEASATEPEAEAGSNIETVSPSESEIDNTLPPETEPPSIVPPETEANVAPVAPAETEPEPTTEAVVDNVAETEPEEATEAVVDDTNENETEPVADSATTPEMEPETATEAEAETEPETEPTVQPDAEIIGIEIPTEELLVFSRSSAASLVVNAPVTMTTNEDSSWRAEDLIPEHLKSSILYENVFPGIDLLYTAYGYDVKEQIIVREKQNSYRYDFLLELDGLTAVLNEDGSVSLVDAQQNVVYNIPVPYMEDADHNISYDVFYSLEEVAGGVVLTIEADADWINEEGRAFPVAIDPTLELVTNAYSNKIYAGFVAAGSPDKSYKGDDYIYTGFGAAAENQEFQAFLYFNNIPDVPDGYTLVETNLYIATLDYSAQGQCFELPLGLYGISSGGPSSGANIDNWLLQLTWNTKPIVNKANTIDYVTLSGATNGNYVSWDMTELCEAWYADSNISRVAALCIPDGVNCSSNYCASPRFYSPQNANSAVIFVVSYRDITGIEPYYTYSTFDVGLAGTAYISDVTGQSKVVKEVATYASTVNPFSLNLVYNSDYFSDNSTIDYQPPTKIDLSMKLGSGWTLDIIQRVVAETISGTSYLRYHDGDGTIHYFVKNGNEYCDEDGLGLKIVDSGNNVYTMSDNQDNKWIFTNSYLTEIQDNNGNKYKINYSDKKIETIVQTNNNGTAITVASFSYDSNKYLTTITDSAGDAYHLGYSGDNLISVTRNTNTVANYSYSGHQLTKITDTLPNYSLELSYANGKVSSYKELGGDGTGAQCDITYPNNSKTTYHDYGVNRVKGDTDDILTHYLFDYAGRTVNAYTTDINGKVLGATNAVYTGSNSTDKKNNRVQRTASVGVTSQQLLQDFGFEVGTSGTSWAFSDVSNIDAQVGINSEKPRTGTNSLHVRIGSGVTNEVSSSHVTKALKAGTTYTLSAYFNTSGVTAFDGRGLCLLVTKSGNTVAKSNYLNYKTSAAVDNGWIRWSVTFTAAADGVHALGIFCHGTEGHIYVDDLQLEDGNAPSNHNLLENGNMSSSSYGWTLGAGCSYDTQRMKITGSPASINTYAYQDVPINLPSDETYVLSGWVTANAVPDNITNGDADSDTNKQCGLRAVIYYSDNSTENHYVPFNADLTEKQFVSTAIVPKQPDKKVNKIRVVCAYEKNANVAYFDDISLVREAAQTMKYDDDGNLISVISTGQGSENSTYDDNNNLTKLVTNGAGTYTYSYDDSNYKHRPTSVTNGLITQSMTYDGAGNVATSTLKSTDTTFTKTLNSSSEYTNSGNLLSSITDSNDSTTNYTYTSARNKKAGIANTTSVVVKDENNEDVEKIVGRQVTDEFGRLRQAFFINTVEDSSGETLENETELEYIFSKFRLHQIER